MDEQLIAKLREVLEAVGVEEAKIEAALSALEGGEESVPVDEGNVEEAITSNEAPVEEEPNEEAVPVPEGEGEGPVVEEQPVVPEPDSVPPVELPPEEVPPVDVPPEGPGPEDVPPVAPELPPMVSLEEFEAVKTKLEETAKANEALLQRVGSLEEALRSAGVIDANDPTSLGNEIPSAPSNNTDDTTLDDVLREINSKKY